MWYVYEVLHISELSWQRSEIANVLRETLKETRVARFGVKHAMLKNRKYNECLFCLTHQYREE